jgi:hypothetical protein
MNTGPEGPEPIHHTGMVLQCQCLINKSALETHIVFRDLNQIRIWPVCLGTLPRE